MINNKYLEDKYKDRRIFHSIAINSDKLDFKDIIVKVFNVKLNKGDLYEKSRKWLQKSDENSKDGYSAFLTKYIANVDFSLSAIENENKPKEDHSYYIYFIKFPISKDKTIILASCPFINMTRYICNCIREDRDILRGKSIYFQKFDIQHMIETISDKQFHEKVKLNKFMMEIRKNLKMTGTIIQVYGDPKAKIIGIKGKNVPISTTYDDILSAIKNKRILHYSCNLSLQMKGFGRAAFEFDRFGRFAFRIGPGGKNLNTVNQIFKYLYRVGAIKEESKIPHIRSSSQYWDIQNERMQ